MQPSTSLQRTLTFLNDIGIRFTLRAGARGFVDHAAAAPSSVLHEAGHLAILPGRFRHLASDDISKVQRLVLSSVDFSDPDAPEARAALQCSDTEATAWAWAAGEAIGLAPEEIILDHEYGGEGSSIRRMLLLRRHAGINGLASGGFCVVQPGAMETIRGPPRLPEAGHVAAEGLRALLHLSAIRNTLTRRRVRIRINAYSNLRCELSELLMVDKVFDKLVRPRGFAAAQHQQDS